MRSFKAERTRQDRERRLVARGSETLLLLLLRLCFEQLVCDVESRGRRPVAVRSSETEEEKLVYGRKSRVKSTLGALPPFLVSSSSSRGRSSVIAEEQEMRGGLTFPAPQTKC